MKTAIVGGGAAGFFLALNLKEMAPEMEITIFEKSQRVLAKVEISGGGRCNCTNSFEQVKDLQAVYPRGHRLLKRLFKVFGPQDAYKWFEHRGVKLVTQEDQCVYPASQDSHTIIDCFTKEARRMGVVVRTGCKIETLEQLADFDFIAVTTGGSPRAEGLEWLRKVGHEIEQPVPSLFTFNIKDPQLCQLMGTVVENASVQLPGTKLRASGPLLITHWGMSGPAILKLSSYGARLLSKRNYQHQLSVNWTGRNENEVANELTQIAQENAQKQVASYRPYALPQRLWSYLSMKCMGEKSSLRWGELGKRTLIDLPISFATTLISSMAKEHFATNSSHVEAFRSEASNLRRSKAAQHLIFISRAKCSTSTA